MYRIFKKIVYFFCLSIVVCFILLILFTQYKCSITNRKTSSKRTTENEPVISIAYSISKNDWTIFQISKGVRFLKIIANPECILGAKEKMAWILIYEILDSNDNVLVSKEYHQSSELTLYKEIYTKRILSNPFFIKQNRYLGSGYEIIIPLPSYKGDRQIRVKWSSDNSKITGLSLRVAKSIKNISQKNKIKWYRLTDAKREELAKGNIYPSYDLTYAEKSNSLKKRWKSIHPKKGNIFSCEVVKLGTLQRNKLTKIKNNFTKPELIEFGKKHSELFNIYLNSGKDGIFRDHSKEDSEKAYYIFCSLFKNPILSEEIKSRCSNIGMTAAEIRCKAKNFIVIYENQDKKEGRGFFMFCRNPRSNKKVAIEAPHRFFDRKTGRISYFLMLTGYYTAGAWNTVHRYQTPSNVERSSDMAHNPDTFFNAFTRAFIDSTKSNSVMIQLHGFCAKKHIYKNAYPSVVLSEGRNKPTSHFMLYADIIKKTLQTKVLIYPNDNLETLSAKENISAETFEKYSKGQTFIHIEMNNDIRRLLLKNKKIRYNFSKELSSVKYK